MNKEEFLKKLEKELSILNEKERQDIIDEYKDTIEDKVKHGQTEEEAVKDFGDLDELVSGILDAYKINPKYTHKEEGSFNKLTEEGEKLIKKGANKLANMTRDFANNIKDNDTEMNLNLAFEIIIKIFFTLILLAVLTIPFRIFKDLGFSFADTFFSPLSGLVKLIIVILFFALYLGISILIIIALFKQYFKQNNNPQENDDSNEAASKQEEITKVDEVISKEEKPREKIKVVHKNGPTIGSVIMLILKIWVIILILFPLFCIDVATVIGLVISIFYWIKGINLLGLTLLLLGISSMLIWFTTLIFNLTFSKGRVTIIPFFISLVVTIFGTLFFIDMLTNINYIDKVPESYKKEVLSKEFVTDKKIYIYSSLNGETNKKIDETLKPNEFKLNISYNKDDFDIDIYNDTNYTFPESECAYSEDKHLCEGAYNYISLNYDYSDNYNTERQKYNDFINNLKDNKIYNYSKLSEVNVEIVANSETMSLIEIN